MLDYSCRRIRKHICFFILLLADSQNIVHILLKFENGKINFVLPKAQRIIFENAILGYSPRHFLATNLTELSHSFTNDKEQSTCKIILC